MGAPEEQSGKSEARSSGRFRPELTQDEFELEFFESVLRQNDRNGDVLRRQAELLARRGNHQAALLLDQKLTLLYPTDAVAWYNLTCSLALMGQARQAISALTRAIDLGYHDFAHIETDPDLDTLRDHSSFQELLRRQGTAGRDT